MSKLNIPIRTIGVGGRFIAATSIGGVNISGPTCPDEVEAVQQLLWKCGPGSESGIGIALALTGQTLNDLAADEEPPKPQVDPPAA
jgi:hypothetical protein